jgi:hypothetical protein
VYPVPAQNILNVELTGGKAADLRFEILDGKGSLVSTTYVGNNGWNTRKWEINVEQLAQGVYTLRALSSQGTTVVRFVK